MTELTVQKCSSMLSSLVATAALLGGCMTDKGSGTVYSGEVFHATGMYSHQYPYSSVATCEAARRALLSQGYVVADIKADIVNGQKSFQPTADTHVEIAFHVVCVADDSKGKTSTAFINALQDRYAIKKTPTSASLGVGAVGAVSLPFGSSDDSLVKIESETIPPGPIYEQFFDLTGEYLKKIGADFGPEPKHVSTVVIAPTSVATQKPPVTTAPAKTGEDGKAISSEPATASSAISTAPAPGPGPGPAPAPVPAPTAPPATSGPPAAALNPSTQAVPAPDPIVTPPGAGPPPVESGAPQSTDRTSLPRSAPAGRNAGLIDS